MYKIIKLFIVFSFFMISLNSTVYGEQQYRLKEITAEVENALNERRARFSQVEALKEQVLVGENNRGYLKSFSDSPDIIEIVSLENKDRTVIYKSIAKQNNIESAIETIELVFAQVHREDAKAGEKIQDEAGQWIIK